MRKQRAFCIAALVCYTAFVVLGAVIAIGSVADFAALSEGKEGISSALTAFALLLLIILGGVYALFGLVPLVLKIIHTFAKKRFAVYICMLFDLAYTVLHTALLISTLTDGGAQDPLSLILPILLLLLSITTFVANLLSRKMTEASIAESNT